MCGRFTDRYSWREIKELYDLTTPFLTSNFPPRTNIAPTQQSFVVRLAKDGGRELAELKWGLVPSWSKDDTGAARMINARAETVARQPAFRAAFKARPCLVVADGFYEWKKMDSRKQPYAIFVAGALVLAALFPDREQDQVWIFALGRVPFEEGLGGFVVSQHLTLPSGNQPASV